VEVFPFDVVGYSRYDQHPAPEAENTVDQYVLRKGEGLQGVPSLTRTEWYQRQPQSERTHKKCNDGEPEEKCQQADQHLDEEFSHSNNILAHN